MLLFHFGMLWLIKNALLFVCLHFMNLAKQSPDFFVHMAQEIHVGEVV